MRSNRDSVLKRVDSFRADAKRLYKREQELKDALVDAAREELIPEVESSLDKRRDCSYRVGEVRISMAPSTYEGRTGKQFTELPGYINSVELMIELDLFIQSRQATNEEYCQLHKRITHGEVSAIFDRFKKRYHLDDIHFLKKD